MKTKNLKDYYISLALVLLIASPVQAAVTIYKQGYTPYDYQQKGNYGASNPYNPASNNYPYNSFNNPYSENYVNKDPRYCTQIYNHQGGNEGVLCNYINVNNNVGNPYNAYGNPYNNQNYKSPYNTNSPANPYNQFYSPYSPNSVYNSNNYAVPNYQSPGP